MASTPSHILLIQSKPPDKRTPEEREILRKHYEERAAAFRTIREKIVPKENA